MSPDEQLILRPGMPPIRARKIKWYQEPALRKRRLEPPRYHSFRLRSRWTTARPGLHGHAENRRCQPEAHRILLIRRRETSGKAAARSCGLTERAECQRQKSVSRAGSSGRN